MALQSVIIIPALNAFQLVRAIVPSNQSLIAWDLVLTFRDSFFRWRSEHHHGGCCIHFSFCNDEKQKQDDLKC